MKSIKHIVIIFIFINSIVVYGQTKPAKIWATATFNKSNVMLGEPLVVTVTIYTSTWFTEPPEFEEIQVNGALMVRLQSRNSATSKTIGRKQYPAIKQQFVVYPNVLGKNKLPAFNVIATCPPEGDYKGRKRTVTTKERTFNVLSPPKGIDTKNWLAAYNLSITDSWSKPLKKLKAGDVLERRISINATGALSAAIPPLNIDSINFGSIYLKSPLLTNRQNRSSFSGKRIEIINYLLEKDGEFTIPEVKVNWFSLKSRTQKTAVIKATPIEVVANPDLEFILSRQKELQAELLANSKESNANSKEPFTLFGLNWWQLILVISSLILLLKMLIRLLSKFKLKRADKKKLELESEMHYFKILIDAINKGNSQLIINNLFSWYDRFREHKYNPELSDLILKINAIDLEKNLKQLAIEYYKKDNLNFKLSEKEKLAESLKLLRQKILNSKQVEIKTNWLHINP